MLVLGVLTPRRVLSERFDRNCCLNLHCDNFVQVDAKGIGTSKCVAYTRKTKNLANQSYGWLGAQETTARTTTVVQTRKKKTYILLFICYKQRKVGLLM
jgi:hypothetical protein